ncbi:MAG: hypothetical protein IBX39_09500 [Candidatus Methanoperedenaceae archaeon]|nr:hypothetical protein [Candidatus Methanoperedenaceae archaeon]
MDESLLNDPIIQKYAGCTDEIFHSLSPMAKILVNVCKEIVMEQKVT